MDLGRRKIIWDEEEIVGHGRENNAYLGRISVLSRKKNSKFIKERCAH